ncbi:hypothetical protein Cgig2_000005 [Carnegiea gigantea]|uniref:Uncharacterized protein n=1 Tax=Carnegiea gigantea TaxID=171969 RepID=A0A9Q1JW12_9CARY|nr:hypothetical protein Cgig2_000005 [Carnegiea gigantea]
MVNVRLLAINLLHHQNSTPTTKSTASPSKRIASQPVASLTSQAACVLNSPRRHVTRSQGAYQNPNSPTSILPNTPSQTVATENILSQQICSPRRPLIRFQTISTTPNSPTSTLPSTLSQHVVAQKRPLLQATPIPSKRKVVTVGTSELGEDFDLWIVRVNLSGLHDFDVHSLCQPQIAEVDVFDGDVKENLGQANDEESDHNNSENSDFREWQSYGSKES